MGIGIWIYLVNDDDSISRYPMNRFERLTRRNPEECLPEYAGKRVRYAEVAVQFHQREPTDILAIHYLFLTLDSEGRVDQAEEEKERRLVAEMMSFPGVRQRSGRVVDAQPLFAKRRFDQQYKWKPAHGLEAAIVEAVFSGKK